MSCLKLVSVTLYLLPVFHAGAQAINNSIHNRINLKLDSGWYASSTANSTVEWDCINKALTNKCLVYHNDQWFTFKPDRPGPLFINVSNQRCNDQYGVQLLVIEGDPCRTDSYRLKKCIPFTDQSDFFVKLDSLDFEKDYLVNIDGYMGDRCYFDIEFSATPKGTPADAVSRDIQTSVTQRDSVVTIKWSLPDSRSASVKTFQLFRKYEKDKSARLVSVPLRRNTLGLTQREYMVHDTVHQKGRYVYNIYGVSENDVLLLSQKQITYPIRKSSPPKFLKGYKRQIDYFVRRDGNVSVQVLDAQTQRKLFSTTKRSVKGKNTVTLDFTELAKAGTRDFAVVVKSRDAEEHFKVSFEKE